MTTSRKILRHAPHSHTGATLIEAILLIVILSIVVVGTGIALQSLLRVPTANNRVLVVANLLIDKMEKLRALDFATLSATSNGSDSPVIDNVTYTRSWNIKSNPGNAYDANFIQIIVTIDTQSLTTGVCKQ